MLVSRDPFARMEIHKERQYVIGTTCAWCGMARRTKGGKLYLWQYRTESDGGRKWDDNRLFCSRDCRDAYYG